MPTADVWWRFPYADPVLPAPLLPERRPGARAAEVFYRSHAMLRAATARFAYEVVAGWHHTRGRDEAV
ncbi:PaaX family transcriptional regulator C-terminal domain-containing protein [Streptomyces sp. NPDC003077]|uniref:PaaX family transcriptional regulator C-terminal domain-containing protein n=1 Tax=Streptomyces sp. NPDC003077 TaxID=3154443 RepID=UPI0033A92368